MATTTIKDDRALYDRIKRELAKLRKAVVTVGVHGDKASRTDEEGPANNAYIGSVHEFGKGNVPERSFLRASLVTDPKVMNKLYEYAGEVAKGQLRARIAMERVGILAVSEVKKTIQAKIPPSLSEETIKRRLAKGAHGGGAASKAGDLTPLIDTGQLINSIQFRVSGNVAGWGSASKGTSSEAAQ